jgi:hypothetical protein
MADRVLTDTATLVWDSSVSGQASANVVDTMTAVASEALTAGDLVNLWNNSGTVNVRKADASASGKPAHGFVKSSFSSSATATVFCWGTITGLSGLTPGATQFLSGSTPGARTETAPTTTNYYLQVVGIARTATIMDFAPHDPIKRA